MRISTNISVDGRLRTCEYASDEGNCFCVAEATGAGTLITRFKSGGDVLDQTCEVSKDAKSVLCDYLKGEGAIDFTNSGAYERITVDAKCDRCKGEIARELDLKKPEEIRSVPVVPIFVCKSCGRRFYSMTDVYLTRLARRQSSLFSANELREMEKNEREFMTNVREHVIRIFASKKITRLRIGVNK